MHPEHHSLFEIDGNNFTTLLGFYDEVGRVVFSGHPWDRTLEAFAVTLDDLLAEHGPMTVVWKNSQKSRNDLGYPETVRQLEEKLSHAPSDLRQEILFELENAHRLEGDTVYSWIVDIVGERPGITLVLE